MELLTTKICHDFSGSVGAIHNGLEFIAEESSISADSPLFSIVSSNALSLMSKIRLYKALFGITSSEGFANLAHIKDLLLQVFDLSKISILWELSNDHLTHKQAKLLALIAFIASESLIYGGALRIETNSQNNVAACKIIASAEKFKIRENTVNTLSTPHEIEEKLENIFIIMAGLVSQEIKSKISLEILDSGFIFNIEFN